MEFSFSGSLRLALLESTVPHRFITDATSSVADATDDDAGDEEGEGKKTKGKAAALCARLMLQPQLHMTSYVLVMCYQSKSS